MTFLPEKNIVLGILGGGQLARMLCLEARRMGYATLVWSGGPDPEPVLGVADEVITESFNDPAGLENFCSKASVATVEFENIPLETLEKIEARLPLFPGSTAIITCQHRSREKTFLRENGIPCAPFTLVNSLADLEAAYAELGPVAVLKTAAFGYDGKGQVKLESASELAAAWESVDGQPSVLEGFVNFEREISVLVARGSDGETATFPVAENGHRHHILDYSLVPARIPEKTAAQAVKLAEKLAALLDYRGLLAVEFFALPDGSLMVNEMAPRPHNSGHFTQDACVTSQFEQQLRAVCGLPLGSTKLLSPVVMLNLLGDMWRPSLDISALFSTAATKVHLYGKTDPSGRRKMGHVNLLRPDPQTALPAAMELKAKLLNDRER